MVHQHELARADHGIGPAVPLDSRMGIGTGTGLAAEYGRLDDLQEALLGIGVAYLGMSPVRTLRGHRRTGGIEGPCGVGMGEVRGSFAASALGGRSETSLP